MVIFFVYAFRRVPPDPTARLTELGLLVDDAGSGCSMFGDTLVVRDGMGNFPAGLVARALGCTEMVHATAGFQYVPGGAEVEWDVAEVDVGRLVPTRRTLAEGKESFPEGDLRGEPETVARVHADRAMDGVLEGVVPPGTKPRTFGVRVPRGWRPPDPFATLTVGPSVVTWSGAAGAVDLDRTTLAWLTVRLQAAGRLDDRTAAPDLGRWRTRLLARYGPEGSPGWHEEWARLTRPERAAVSPSPRAIAGWKLTEASAILTPAEVVSLRDVLRRPAATPPPALAEAVSVLLPLLEHGEEILVDPL